MPLSDNDMKSELSYSYLHAIASRSGCECETSGRHSDGMGVDARVHVRERFSADALSRFTVEIQLKATSDPPALVKDRFSFWLKAKNYDELRDTNLPHPQLLVVLFLPENPVEWLTSSEESLIARKCAYWLSLYDAPPGSPSGQTVYIPRSNVLSVEGFRVLLARFARKERLRYAP
jgi:Domain of unknown function (DUF4365)